MLAHGKVLSDDDICSKAAVRDLALDHRNAGLDAIDVAVMDLADKAARDATAISAGDMDQARAAGLSDDEIFDVVAVAAARCFFSTMLDALGVEPDAAYAELEPELREALVVRRAISA